MIMDGKKAQSKVKILKISVLVDLATPVITIKCGLKLQLTLLEQLLCQEYNRGATGVSVYSTTKQNHGLIKRLRSF